ncbi:hypothetical protein ACFX2I_013377 [Malus domestica]
MIGQPQQSWLNYKGRRKLIRTSKLPLKQLRSIKLILQPGEMKARFEQFKKKAESQLPPLLLKEPLIKVQRNLHPPFLGESLEYMKEFHKTYSANDLYELPNACQEALDLALTCPDAEQIIQKTTDPAMKARAHSRG